MAVKMGRRDKGCRHDGRQDGCQKVTPRPVTTGRRDGPCVRGFMACLHGAIVAAIGRATDRRDRLHVCLHGATDRTTNRRDDLRDDRTV